MRGEISNKGYLEKTIFCKTSSCRLTNTALYSFFSQFNSLCTRTAARNTFYYTPQATTNQFTFRFMFIFINSY